MEPIRIGAARVGTTEAPVRREISAMGRTCALSGIDEAVILSLHATLLFVAYGGFTDVVAAMSVLQVASQVFVVRPVLKLLYFTGFMVATNGLTPGLYATNGRLVSDAGTRVTAKTVLGWYLPAAIGRRIPVVGAVVGAINIAMVFTNRRRRAIGDFVVKTTVRPNSIPAFVEVAPYSPAIVVAPSRCALAGQPVAFALDLCERLTLLGAGSAISVLVAPALPVHVVPSRSFRSVLFLSDQGELLKVEELEGRCWRVLRTPREASGLLLISRQRHVVDLVTAASLTSGVDQGAGAIARPGGVGVAGHSAPATARAANSS